jgi:hypothetical protein
MDGLKEANPDIKKIKVKARKNAPCVSPMILNLSLQFFQSIYNKKDYLTRTKQG